MNVKMLHVPLQNIVSNFSFKLSRVRPHVKDGPTQYKASRYVSFAKLAFWADSVYYLCCLILCVSVCLYICATAKLQLLEVKKKIRLMVIALI